MKLDGWEEDDDPLKEHLAHSGHCDWATSLAAGLGAQQNEGAEDEQRDPMSEELVAARRRTFEHGAGWPHESKRGWKCKVSKMVEAGWCFDPAPSGEEEDGDGVTCFHCNLSLDGWEPKDDPFQEHRKRSPKCTFFALCERFGSSAEGKKGGRGKGGKAKGGRASVASRLSTQSALSTFSDAPSITSAGLAQDTEAQVDDSIVTTATTASQATGTTKGKKKGGRPKAPAKGAKGRKRADTVDSEAAAEPVYPNLSSQAQSKPMLVDEEVIIASQPEIEEPAVLAPPAQKTRKGTRQSKQQVDSSVFELSSVEATSAAAPKKTTRGRKAKAQQSQPEPESQRESDMSEVSAQLQEELERFMSFEAQDESTPQPAVADRPNRGVKRTSKGLRKAEEEQPGRDSSVVAVEFPVPPKPIKDRKGKKGSKLPIGDESEVEQPPAATQEDVQMSDVKVEAPKPTKSKKAPAAKGKGRPRKASSTRSSRSSKATITPSEPEHNEPEDLENDEREIEVELERIAAEQKAIEAEQERTAEFETSPSHAHAQNHVEEIQQLEQELQNEVQAMEKPGRNLAEYVANVAGAPATGMPHTKASLTPSPSGSDKENVPSSVVQPSAKQAQQRPILSPTKTTRIPLAPGTPNRVPMSPSKRNLLSPSKQQLSKLTSTAPWEAVDLDTVLLASPNSHPTPSTLSQRLAEAAGTLPSPEKGLTVEAWVRLQAERGEEALRRRCEEVVGVFEREGMRALGALGGVVVDVR